MALATKCPHCNTIFRVAADQLKLRGGIVRCGTCKEVFDGNAALLDPGAAAVHTQAGAPRQPTPFAFPPSPARSASAAPAPAPTITHALAVVSAPADSNTPSASGKRDGDAAEPTYAVDFDTSFDPFGILPESAQPEELTEPVNLAPEPEPESEPEPEQAAVAAPAEPEVPVMVNRNSDAEPFFGAAPQQPQPAEVQRHEPSLFDPLEAEPQEHLVAAALPGHDEQEHELELELEHEHELEHELEERPAAPDLKPEPAFESAAPREVADLAQAASVPMRASRAPDPAEAGSAVMAPVVAPRKPAKPPKAARVSQPKAEERSDPDEPGFVKQSRRRERTGKSMRVALGLGSLLLAAGLLTQIMTGLRNPLAAQVPALRPALVGLCGLFGCRVDLPAQLDSLSIEQGELQTLAANTYSYATVLRNQGDTAQVWPHLELVLTDNDKPVLRRVFAPRDYLPATTALGTGFAPRTEQTVKLYFELAQIKASGYHIAVFYP